MNDSKQDELLELYKLHAELADRVSHRREGANRMYVTLVLGLAVFLAAMFRFGSGAVPVEVVLCVASMIGVLLTVSWYIVIRSYRQLNSGKFLALHELEQQLAYPFFTREWELLGEGENVGRYWKLTVVEVALPFIFFALFAGLAVFSFLL